MLLAQALLNGFDLRVEVGDTFVRGIGNGVRFAALRKEFSERSMVKSGTDGVSNIRYCG